MRTKHFRQIIPFFSSSFKCPPAPLMESFNGERKFISSDYSCGVAVLLPVRNCKTAVSLYLLHACCHQTTSRDSYLPSKGMWEIFFYIISVIVFAVLGK